MDVSFQMKIALKTDEKKAYEELLLTGDITKSLKRLTAGTPSHSYLYFLNQMRSPESFAALSES